MSVPHGNVLESVLSSIRVTNQKSILIAEVLFLLVIFVSLTTLRASHEYKPDLCPCSSGFHIILPKPN